MKSPLQKSPIPSTHAFLIKKLEDSTFDPTWHFHSEYQLFSVLKGKGSRFIGDNISPFLEGDLTLTGPNLPHLWKSESNEGSKGIVVYFNKDLIGEKLSLKEELIKVEHLLKRSERGIEITGETAQIVRQMLLSLLDLQGFERVLHMLKILHILSESKDLKTIVHHAYNNSLKIGDTERMNTVYTYVMENFKKEIKVTELARMTNMTPSSFSRYFKIHANKTFSEFLSEVRIGHACRILLEDNVNISNACYLSGFQTLSNFNRQFKKITKRTPRAYRKEFEIT